MATVREVSEGVLRARLERVRADIEARRKLLAMTHPAKDAKIIGQARMTLTGDLQALKDEEAALLARLDVLATS